MAIEITTQPAAYQSIRQGDTITLTVEANNVTGWAWYKQGTTTPVPGQNTKTLTIPNAKPEHFGIYRCKLTANGQTAVYTDGAVIQEDTSAPWVNITVQPTEVRVDADEKITMTCTAVTNEKILPLRYDWVQGNVVRGTTDAGTFDVEYSTSSDAGDWKCIARCGTAYAVSKTFRVIVSDKPFIRITNQPAAMSAAENVDALFVVRAVTNYPDQLTYQWQKDGANIDAGTTPSAATSLLHMSPVTAADNAKKLKCVMTIPAIGTHAQTTVTSREATLTVTAAFAITISTQPAAAVSAYTAQKVELTCNARTNDPRYLVSYQWKKDDVVIPGATEPVYTFVGADDTMGSYTCLTSAGSDGNHIEKVSNASVVSRNNTRATLAITNQPRAIDVASGIPSVLSVTATTNHPMGIEYQWKKDNVAIPGATSPLLVFESPAPSDNGMYKCDLASGDGNVQATVTSNPVQVTATDGKAIALRITAQPQPQVKTLYEKATFSVTATTDGKPLTYQWYKDGMKLSGQTANSVSVQSTNGAAGKYWVVVCSGAKELKSDVVTLTINAHDKINVTLQPKTVVKQINNDVAQNTAILSCDAVSTEQGQNPTFAWYKDGVAIAGQTNKTTTVANITENTAHYYQCMITVNGQSVFTKPAWVIGVKVSTTKYVHPLKCRDSSFMWKGYWVTDEIKEFTARGQNWLINRQQLNAKYAPDIDSIVYAMATYGVSEVQESRDGYVLKFFDIPWNTPVA